MACIYMSVPRITEALPQCTSEWLISAEQADRMLARYGG